MGRALLHRMCWERILSELVWRLINHYSFLLSGLRSDCRSRKNPILSSIKWIWLIRGWWYSSLSESSYIISRQSLLRCSINLLGRIKHQKWRMRASRPLFATSWMGSICDQSTCLIIIWTAKRVQVGETLRNFPILPICSSHILIRISFQKGASWRRIGI